MEGISCASSTFWKLHGSKDDVLLPPGKNPCRKQFYNFEAAVTAVHSAIVACKGLPPHFCILTVAGSCFWLLSAEADLRECLKDLGMQDEDIDFFVGNPTVRACKVLDFY